MEEIQRLRQENQELRQMLQKVLEANEALRAQLKLSSFNFSKPPSSDSPKARADRKTRKRPPSDKKAGGQKGHEGHHRQMLPVEQVDHVVDCIPKTCSGCSESLHGHDATARAHQVWDLPPIALEVTQYNQHTLQCSCGQRTTGQLPAGITRSSFGPGVLALHAVLRVQMRASRGRTKSFFNEVLGLQISTGALSAMNKRVSAHLASAHEQLGKAIAQSNVAYCDETTWWLSGKRQVMWAACTKGFAYLKIQPKRDQISCQKLVGSMDFSGCIVSDRYCGYHRVDNAQRQLCWAHVLRDFIYISERSDRELSMTGERLVRLASDMLQEYARARDGTLQQWQEFTSKWQSKRDDVQMYLEMAAREGGKSKAGGMAREMLKYEQCLWTFLSRRDVEPTNNLAERTLRHAVILRKTSYGSRSQAGMRFVERAVSVYQTMVMQSRSFYAFLRQTFDGLQPQVLPT